jgi:hypothetical protein
LDFTAIIFLHSKVVSLTQTFSKWNSCSCKILALKHLYSAILVMNVFNYMESRDICKISFRMITTPLTIADPLFFYHVPSGHEWHI